MKKNALVHNFVVHKLVYQCFYLSFCHFVILSFSLRRELRGMPAFVELLSRIGHLTVQKWTLALIVGTHFQMVMCMVQFL